MKVYIETPLQYLCSYRCEIVLHTVQFHVHDQDFAPFLPHALSLQLFVSVAYLHVLIQQWQQEQKKMVAKIQNV